MKGLFQEVDLINRRSFLKHTALVPLIGATATSHIARAADEVAGAKADYTLRIGTGLVELAPNHIVSTTLYNDQFPGPLLRLKEGRPVAIEIRNDTDAPELVHMHGQLIPSAVDGAAEEGSPFIPPHSVQRLAFTP